jgi:hypothetical protein
MTDSNALQRQMKEALKHQDRSWATFMQTWKIPLILGYYGFCSSTLIVINKVAVHTLQAPVFILVLQLLFSAVVVKGLNFAGVLEAEGLQWNLVKPFMLIVLGFLGTLYGQWSQKQNTISSSHQIFIVYSSPEQDGCAQTVPRMVAAAAAVAVVAAAAASAAAAAVTINESVAVTASSYWVVPHQLNAARTASFASLALCFSTRLLPCHCLMRVLWHSNKTTMLLPASCQN